MLGMADTKHPEGERVVKVSSFFVFQVENNFAALGIALVLMTVLCKSTQPQARHGRGSGQGRTESRPMPAAHVTSTISL